MAADVLWHLSYGQLISPPRFTSHVADTRAPLFTRARTWTCVGVCVGVCVCVCVCVCDTRSCVWYAISHTTMCYFMSWCSDRGAVFFREIYKITFSQVIFSLFLFLLFLYSNAETFDANKSGFSIRLCVSIACTRGIRKIKIFMRHDKIR